MIVKIIFLMAAVAVFVVALPLDTSPGLLTYRSSRTDDGYDFSYSTEDQSRDEHGVVLLQKDGDHEVEVLEVRGSYSFIGDDNLRYTVDYVAGVNGYRANTTITAIPLAQGAPVTGFGIDPNALKSLVG